MAGSSMLVISSLTTVVHPVVSTFQGFWDRMFSKNTQVQFAESSKVFLWWSVCQMLYYFHCQMTLI